VAVDFNPRWPFKALKARVVETPGDRSSRSDAQLVAVGFNRRPTTNPPTSRPSASASASPSRRREFFKIGEKTLPGASIVVHNLKDDPGRDFKPKERIPTCPVAFVVLVAATILTI